MITPANTLKVLALRVAFEPDDNVSTTGDGEFLTGVDSINCDGFLVDPLPHDANYFRDQVLAVGNYFRQVSGGHVDFDTTGITVHPPQDDPPIRVGPMTDYSATATQDSSDALLVRLVDTALSAAWNAGVDPHDYQLVIVFHAGLGQDFAYETLDPTPLDIPSAYIDSAMILAALGVTGIPLPDGSRYKGRIVLAPEGQNHIYYDIADDLFFGANDYCDLQTGLTGTLALLIGYSLGFPPLFDTEAGETGVGVFGLMDLGSNNGRGVIPAAPTAWTRAYLGWEQPVELSGTESLAARHLGPGGIGRITLSRDEYLLLENRVNWIGPEAGVDLDSLLYRNRDEVSTLDIRLPPWFDYLVDSVGVTVSGSGVITGTANYDMGLPGSGLLIWHVDESRYTNGMAGINNQPEARAVSLVEADGAVDLGFPTTALFGNPDQGWRWDLWYAGNEAFFMVNPDRLGNNPEQFLALDAETNPALRLNRGAAPGLAISQIGPAGDTLTFTVDMDAGGGVAAIERLPEGSRLLGYNGVTWIYGLRDSLWMGSEAIAELDDGDPAIVIGEHDAPSLPDDGFWVLQLFDTGYVASRYRSDGSREYQVGDSAYVYNPNFGEPFPFYDEGKLTLRVSAGRISPDTSRVRYLTLSDTSGLNPAEGVSLADVDGDGESDWVTASLQNQDGHLWAQSDEGTMLDGYPINGDFQSIPLIANLMDGIRPEIVVVEDGAIAIYSPEGREQLRLGLHANPDELFLMHTSDGRVGLANGDRIHWFEPEEQNPQWVTPQGRHSRNRVSLNDGLVKVRQPAVLDKARVYNYPNPVTEGQTKIRFYTGEATRATIRIFTVEGLPVSEVTLTGLASNDYNEWVWQVGDNPSGLYYAVVEVEGSSTESALIKIAVVR